MSDPGESVSAFAATLVAVEDIVDGLACLIGFALHGPGARHRCMYCYGRMPSSSPCVASLVIPKRKGFDE